MFTDWTIQMTKIMSKENLKKFIKKYNQIANTTKNHGSVCWLQGVNDLMKALRIDIEYLDKYNELDDKAE